MHAPAPRAGVPESNPPTRALDFLGFEPTPAQRLVKAAYWRAWAEDPSVDPASTTSAHVMQICDAPSIDKWWKQSGFRDWFVGREEWKIRADAAAQMWLDTVIRRLSGGGISDKDLVGLGRVLAEVAGHTGRGVPAEKSVGQAKLPPSEAEARIQFERLASALGWTPPRLTSEPDSGGS